MENYKYWSDKLASQELEDFTSNPEAKLWLKIHSIAKRDVLQSFLKKENIVLTEKKVDARAQELYKNICPEDIDEWNQKLDSFFREKNEEQLKELDLEKLKLELYQVQHFKWGGDQNNSLDKYFVTHYVKSVKSYQDLHRKLQKDAFSVVANYVCASWYNHWTSIIIEHIFKQHPSVLPTVGQVKSIDFIVKGIPFDLKVTYLPKWFGSEIKKYLKSQKYPETELKALKQIAKKCDVKFDSSLPENEQFVQILAQLKYSSQEYYNEAQNMLNAIREKTVEYAIAHKRDLIRLLYEKQGSARFGAENRLYLILIDKEDMQNSWQMKRAFMTLEKEINKYLDSFKQESLSDLKLDFTYSGKQYTTHSDIIFVVK